ncbi:MAG: EscU/YscU/HrcU family type III secretion system export apparatus switch protein [Desulfobacterota bacterium]|jgi:flagellar biosynthesis protein|nr:EscU/YscU/HrcU family type III secretion system export apparatus switch protein [Thermodesulfobacteriota bacterium]
MKNADKNQKAVALAYKPGLDRAPKVTAKGRGRVAEKIIELARQHHLAIQEDPDLVEALSLLDLNQEIPEDLYIVVAELLAFLYTVNGKKGTG